MQTQTILAIVFSALFIFSCKKDDESVDTSMIIGEVKNDTSQVDTIKPLESFGVENGCLLSASIDSAELLWDDALDEYGGNYIYGFYTSGWYMYDDWASRYFATVQDNMIVQSIRQDTWNGETTEQISFEERTSTFNQVFNTCRNVKKEADSLGLEFTLSYSKDGVICECWYQLPDSLISCTDLCDGLEGIKHQNLSFKWTE